jgi:NAD(P)-dependent dehydrogenase (short-subunit alcohol dehydrogenase family)
MGILENKAVVVTGAARGLGRAYALRCAAEGADVVVNDIDGAELGTVADEIAAIGRKARAVVGSVASPEDAAAVVEDCVAAFGRIDGLVNNAGIIRPARAWETDPADARAQVEVNLLGAIYVGTAALRHMHDQGYGSVVNASSSSHMGRPSLGVYSATKGALASLSYSWSIDCRDRGIRVNAIAPSARTRMSSTSPNKVGLGSPAPEANAPIVAYLLSDLSDGVTGQHLQLRGEEVVLVSPPSLSDHAVRCGDWDDPQSIARLDSMVRAHLQPVGFWPEHAS